MNGFASIGFQKRRIRRFNGTLTLHSPISVTTPLDEDVLVGRKLRRSYGQGSCGGGGIDGWRSSRRRRNPMRRGVVGPRSCDDLRNSNVTAVSTGLSAQLTLEVRRKPQDQGREAMKRRRSAGGGVEAGSESSLAELLEPRSSREIGIWTTLEGGENPSATWNSHFRRFYSSVVFSLSFSQGIRNERMC